MLFRSHALHLFYTDAWPRSRVAGLAALVDNAAQEGDAVAIEILNGAGMQLAMLAASVRGQLWSSGEAVKVAYIGGVFASRLLLERFRLLVEMEAGNCLQAPQYGPVEGALLEAYRSCGVAPVLFRA